MAHALCNNYRWDYSAEEFQWILKIGVWARRQMELESPVGRATLAAFFEYDRKRDARRGVRREAPPRGAPSSTKVSKP
jgi:hypothetical protein